MNQSKFQLRVLPLVLLASLSVLSACNGGGGSSTAAAGGGSTAQVNDKNGNKVTVASSAGMIMNLTSSGTAPAGAPAMSFPNGFFSYQITGLTAGQKVTVTLTLPAGSAPTQAQKCIAGVCKDLVGLGKASIAGDVVTLTLQDGDADTDSDGAANGTIVDPVGPANFVKATGASEPLFVYQWGLKKLGSYFADLTGINFTANDGLDLNVETVHNGTYTGNDGKEVKGAGVNVLVLDDGVDIRNEDLIGRVDTAQTRNFDFAADSTADSEFNNDGTPKLALKAKDDPTPVTTKDGKVVNQGSSHGTNVAGIILASQNGLGVMGIAPLATLGGASYLGTATGDANQTEAYGGGNWSNKADVINASFGSNPAAPPSYDPAQNGQTVRGLVNLRSGKGALFVKATGNEFGGLPNATPVRTCTVSAADNTTSTPLKGIVSCETPANDTEGLEQNVMMVGAVNAAGVKSSYSNGGGVNWVMGLGGEFGGNGKYGEAKGADSQGNEDAGSDGPTMFSTDLRGCKRGYSNDASAEIKEDYRATTDFLKGLTKNAKNVDENKNCDYSYMNGTSAATPTVTGVVALMLSANPNLGWRDIREILAGTAKPVDANYVKRVNPNPANANAAYANPFNLMERRFANTQEAGAGGLCEEPATNGMLTGRCAVLDYGTQATGSSALSNVSNGKALNHSLWYGFGLVDAKAAVEAAKSYTTYLRTTITADDNPDFAPISYELAKKDPNVTSVQTISYGTGQLLGSFTPTAAVNVGQIQLRVTADSLCIGSVGFVVVKNGLGRAVLSTPLNSYYSLGGQAAVSSVSNYTLGSYAFYGAIAGPNSGTFDVYAVATRPNAAGGKSDSCAAITGGNFDNVSTGANGMKVEWRILPRVLDLKAGGKANVGSPNT